MLQTKTALVSVSLLEQLCAKALNPGTMVVRFLRLAVLGTVPLIDQIIHPASTSGNPLAFAYDRGKS